MLIVIDAGPDTLHVAAYYGTRRSWRRHPLVDYFETLPAVHALCSRVLYGLMGRPWHRAGGFSRGGAWGFP